MLLNLRIRNFAIIDEAELEFSPGFTVITGETGAGKSILVNAMTLILGGRASIDLIRAGAETAEVEALFDVTAQPVVQRRLAERQLVGDDAGLLVVRRVISVKGRGRVSINGGLASVATLAEIVRGLVDISGQHEQQSLLLVDNHLDILDASAGHDELLSRYRSEYVAWQAAGAERDRLRRSEEELLRRADYLRFQVDEIERVAPVAGELQNLETDRSRLAHAEKLKSGALLAEGLVYGDDGSAFDRLSKAVAELEALARLDAMLTPVAASLAAARKDVQEAARELQRYEGRIEADPDRLETVEGRLVELRRLARKHGGDLDQLLVRYAEIKEELVGLDDSDGRMARLEQQVGELEKRLEQTAAALSSSRCAAAERLGAAVAAEVCDMDLAGAVFAVQVERRPPSAGESAFGPSGVDQAEFLWSANPGEPPRPLARIVSGGELSRLMLAVKRVMSNRDLVSLYVFDEVDTGLGGKTADTIGRKIQAVAEGHQAIVITHLAPIAAYAGHHLVVRKLNEAGRTASQIAGIDGTARAEELARMIDGAHITKTTRQAARDMLARNPAA